MFGLSRWAKHASSFFKQLSESTSETDTTPSGQKSSLRTASIFSVPRDTIQVLDVSGSMGSPDYPPTRLDGGIQAATEYATARMKQSQNDRIAVVSFNDAAQVVLPLTPIADRKTIIMAIRRLTAGGGTDIAVGLWAAAGIFANEPQSNRQRHIIVLTDGQGGRPLKIANKLKKEYCVVIDVVGIGGSPGDVNESLLRKLATTDSDGFCHYRYIKDPQTLSEHYRQLAKGIVWRGRGK